jgi:Tol biopolymer transport system component/DNA-binding winged helix-turn-helix (wHTH) protein
MPETERQLRLLRFGDFEVNLRSGELRKAGVKLKFGGQPFQVLSILLEQPGEVVTREELQKRLWPDTFVDVDHNLNTAINKIREVLGDSAESPRFVETLPRRGYRFIGELEPPVESVTPVVTFKRDRGFLSRRWLKVAAGVLAISVVAFAAVVAYRWHRQQSPQEQAVLTAVPFTALRGRATSPAFSPDGSRIAFAWNGDPKGGAKGFDLYVKAIGSETLLRLTQHPSDWISPAWSPDGTQVAFHRLAGADTGIYVVPALGGPERKLRPTRIAGETGSIISWSPDGKWIALADALPEEEHARVYLLSTDTLEIKPIPISPRCDSERGPAFSHNGEYLAYWCSRRAENDDILYSLPISGGQPKMISLPWAYPNGLTWSADDKRLIYSLYPFGNETSAEIGEINIASGSTKRLAFAGSAMLPAVSPRGEKLVYSSLSTSLSIWRRDLLHPEGPGVELIPSSRAQWGAQYSPDGKRIALQSLRSGVLGAWVSNEDGSDLVQISIPTQPSGSPQWSPDGNKIAFDSLVRNRWEIYVADVAERKPRKLVTNISNVIKPHWSRDGKWIYFSSNEVGRTGVYRSPASGGDAIPLSKDADASDPQESFDGKTVYFASHVVNSTLKQVALPGQPGGESIVDGLPRLSNYSLWTLSPGGIYFVPAEAPRSVRYLDFTSRQIRPIFEVEKDFARYLSLSPDGRFLLYSQIGDASGDIMLVDHFR